MHTFILFTSCSFQVIFGSQIFEHLRKLSKPGFALSPLRFYILSLRGDTIITRDFRGDVVKGTAEIFFRKVTGRQKGRLDAPKAQLERNKRNRKNVRHRPWHFMTKVKFWHGDAPPIFNLDGVTWRNVEMHGNDLNALQMLHAAVFLWAYKRHLKTLVPSCIVFRESPCCFM